MNSIAQAPNATTNGGDASRVGIEKGEKIRTIPDAGRVAPIRGSVWW